MVINFFLHEQEGVLQLHWPRQTDPYPRQQLWRAPLLCRILPGPYIYLLNPYKYNFPNAVLKGTRLNKSKVKAVAIYMLSHFLGTGTAFLLIFAFVWILYELCCGPVVWDEWTSQQIAWWIIIVIMIITIRADKVLLKYDIWISFHKWGIWELSVRGRVKQPKSYKERFYGWTFGKTPRGGCHL